MYSGMSYPESNTSDWYCAHTKSRHEDKEFHRFTDKSIHPFFLRWDPGAEEKTGAKKNPKTSLPDTFLFMKT